MAPLYLFAEYALLFHWLLAGGEDAMDGLWFHALFVSLNAAALFYGIKAFIGLRNSREDLQPVFNRAHDAIILRTRQLARSLVSLGGEGTTTKPTSLIPKMHVVASQQVEAFPIQTRDHTVIAINRSGE